MSEVGEIAAWLRAQAEADIEAAGAATPGPWEFEGDDPTDDDLFTTHEDSARASFGDTVAYVRGRDQVANGRHMERHDPLTETARAESVLAVLDAYEGAVRRQVAERADYAAWVRGEAPVERPAFPGPGPVLIPGLELTVRLLAAGYRYREGYEEAWRP